ncbi:MAG: hypothetical protein JXO22_10090 [Phycisphaerae bacterium]|nr:hypothetical protein [Phycisphaerae bacterium]
MKSRATTIRVLLLAPLATLCSLPGCVSGLMDNIDMLLAPGAYENALNLPYSDVLPLARLFYQFWVG